MRRPLRTASRPTRPSSNRSRRTRPCCVGLCGKLFDILCDGYATRAKLCWDQDRRLEAEDLAARLRRDPSRNALKLQRTSQGSALMIERWEALGRILRETGTWTEAQRSL